MGYTFRPPPYVQMARLTVALHQEYEGGLIPSTVDAVEPLVPDSFQDQYERVNGQRTRYRTSTGAAILTNGIRRGLLAGDLIPALVDAGTPLVPDSFQDQFDRVNAQRTRYRTSSVAAAIGANADRRGIIADTLYPNLLGSYITATSQAFAGTIATTEAAEPLVPDEFQDQIERVRRLRVVYRSSSLTAAIGANADRRGAIADVLYPNLTGFSIAAASVARAGTIATTEAGVPLVPDDLQDQIERVRGLRTRYRSSTLATVAANADRRGSVADVLYPNLTGSYITATSQAFAGTLTSSTAGVPLVPDGFQDQIERVRSQRTTYRTTTVATVEANADRRGGVADVLYPNLTGSYVAATSQAFAGSIATTGAGVPLVPDGFQDQIQRVRRHRTAYRATSIDTVEANAARRSQTADVLHPNLVGSYIAATSVCRAGTIATGALVLVGSHIAATSVCRPGALQFSRPAVSEPVRLLHRDRSRLIQHDRARLVHREQSRHIHREPPTRLVRRERSRLIYME